MTAPHQRVLITGIDTRLGVAVGKYFAANGAAIVGTSHGATGGAPTDSNAWVAVPNSSGRQDICAAVARAAELMGGIDVLVVAHGLPLVAQFADQSVDEFWKHVDGVLTGSFYYAQAAAEAMRASGGGRMVFTTSKYHVGGSALSAVATAAGGIVALTKSLTRDLGRFGIGVNAVAIGAIDSEWSICDCYSPCHQASHENSNTPPLGHVGSVDEVARIIGLLSRRRLGAAVGQIVNVDGGFSRNRV